MIGVFDSGLGGLTVLKHFLNKPLKYDYIYFGDNVNAPYGDLSQKEIYQHSKNAVDFLFTKGAKLIIFACNTASSQALRKIQQEYLPQKYPGKNVIGVVRPLAEYVARKNFQKVGIIGTKTTIKSQIYKKEIKTLNPNIKIYQKSAPLLVPLIERKEKNEEKIDKILKKYLKNFQKEKIDMLVLACTHYPHLIKNFQKNINAKIPCPGKIIANSLEKYLKKHREELKIKEKDKPSVHFYFSGKNPDKKALKKMF